MNLKIVLQAPWMTEQKRWANKNSHAKHEAAKVSCVVDRWPPHKEQGAKGLKCEDEPRGWTGRKRVRHNVDEDGYAELGLGLEHTEGPEDSTDRTTSAYRGNWWAQSRLAQYT